MSTVKNVAIVAILLGTAYFAYANRNRIVRILQSGKAKHPNGRVNIGNAMTEVCAAFLMYADSFQGIFEPLYKASVGEVSFERMKNVLNEWDIRMGNIAQSPVCLKSWWATIIAEKNNLSEKELKERLQHVMKMILLCGIVRDNRTEIEAAEDTGIYYQTSDGVRLITGHKLHIESPCWYLESSPVRVIEKGYCEIL